MYALFLAESIKDGLESYGIKIEPSLEFSGLKEVIDPSDMIFCEGLTMAVLAKLRNKFPGLPIKCCGDAPEMSITDEVFNEVYSDTGLSTNTVEASQMLRCVVTRDGVLLMYKSDVLSDDTFCERVIKGMADTQSIDDILKHEVSVYHSKISI